MAARAKLAFDPALTVNRLNQAKDSEAFQDIFKVYQS